MEYVFFLILLILCVANLQCNHHKFVKPSTLYISTFVLAMGVYLTAFEEWDVNLSGVSCIIMIIGYIMFWLGESVGSFVYQSLCKKNISVERTKLIFKVPKLLNIIVLCICIVTIYLSFYKMLDFISFANISTDSDTVLSGVRYAKLMGEKTGIVLALLTIIFDAISFIYLVIFLNNLIIGHKFELMYFIFSVCGVVPGLLFASRYPLINYFIQSIAIVVVIMQWKYDWHYVIRLKDILVIFFAMVLFLGLFLVLGTFTGKVELDNVTNALQVYIASPIQGVDSVINNEGYYVEQYPGVVIFGGVYNLLSRLGILEEVITYYQYLPAGRLVTNIYSANGDWFILAGVLGVVAGQFCVGAILGAVYSYIKRCPHINLMVVFYFYIAQAYLGRVWAERFFTTTLDFTFSIVLICWVVFWQFVNKKKISL